MTYVIMLHVLGQGGVLAAATTGVQKCMVWFLEVFAFCAVDCFALISGYVGFRDGKVKLKLANYLTIWFQVVFYTLLITVVFQIVLPDAVHWLDYVKAFLPVTMSTYWYFTAYTGLFFVAPIINAAVQGLEETQAKRIVIVLFAVFSIYATLVPKDVFALKDGYSFVWLILMYFIGAVMKKTGMLSGVSCRAEIIGVLLLCLIGVVWRLYSGIISAQVFGKPVGTELLLNYVSPTVLIAAVIHLLLFKRIEVSPGMKKAISFAAPGAFAAYIINTNPFIWEYCMKSRFEALVNYPTYLMPVIVIGFSVIFVLLSVTMDGMRRWIFHILRIERLPAFIDDRIHSLFAHIHLASS